jgi:hypothetical protein
MFDDDTADANDIFDLGNYDLTMRRKELRIHYLN